MIQLVFSASIAALLAGATYYLCRYLYRHCGYWEAMTDLNTKVNRVNDKVEMLRTEIAEGPLLQVDEDAEFMAIMHRNEIKP